MRLKICISLLLICHYFTFITEFKITPAKTCLRWVTRPICIISSQSPSRCGKLLLARVMCGFLHKSCYFYITGETMIDLILIQGPPCLWIFSWFPPFSDHYSIATLPPPSPFWANIVQLKRILSRPIFKNIFLYHLYFLHSILRGLFKWLECFEGVSHSCNLDYRRPWNHRPHTQRFSPITENSTRKKQQYCLRLSGK